MSFIAILDATPAGRVGKYAEFDTLVEAQAHVTAFVADYPQAFAIEAPAASWSHWLIDMIAKTVAIDDAEYVAAEAARQAEEQRTTAFKADAIRQDMITRLTSATPAQISTFVDNNVTDLAGARTMLKRILLVLATAIDS